jgi:hypothetical protein
MGEITVAFVSAELAGQWCSDLRQAVEGPLGCPLGNACFSPDGTPRVALGAWGRYHGTVYGDSRPSEPLAFSPGIPNTGADTLGNQAALKLGDSAKHSENHLARGRAGFHVLRE